MTSLRTDRVEMFNNEVNAYLDIYNIVTTPIATLTVSFTSGSQSIASKSKEIDIGNPPDNMVMDDGTIRVSISSVDWGDLVPGDDVLVTANVVKNDFVLQDQDYFIVPDAVDVNLGGGASGGSGSIGTVSIDDYRVGDGGSITVDWSGSTNIPQSINGDISLTGDGRFLGNAPIGVSTYGGGSDSGEVTIEPAYGGPGTYDISISATLKANGESVSDLANITVEVSGSDQTPAAPGVEVKYFYSDKDEYGPGDLVNVDIGYGFVIPSDTGEVDANLIIENKDDSSVIYEEGVTVTEEWGKKSITVEIAQDTEPGPFKLCAEMVK